MPQVGLKRGASSRMDDSRSRIWSPFKRRTTPADRSTSISDLSMDSTASHTNTSFSDRIASALSGKLTNLGLLNPPETSQPYQDNVDYHDGFSIVGERSLGLRASAPASRFDIIRLKRQMLDTQRRAYAEKQRLLEQVQREEDEKFELQLIEEKRRAEQEFSQGKTNERILPSLYTESDNDDEDSNAAIPRLTAEQENRVARYMAACARSPRALLVDAFKIDLSNGDFSTLGPRKWLNDNVIDMYLNIVVSDSPRPSAVFTTHFYTKLATEGYSGVRRWALRKKLDVFKPDYVFVPVNQNNTHWTLAVVNNRSKQLEFYDSLPSGKGERELECLATYLAGEAKRLGRDPAIVKEYKRVPLTKAPKQANGFDCGVFMCEVVSRLARNLPLNHTQDDMPIVRKHMAHTILELKKDAKL